MKTIILIIATLTLLTTSACSRTRPESGSKGMGLTYRELIIKDYDEMFAMVKKHLKAAHKYVLEAESNNDWRQLATDELMKAERLILSRPNSDNMVAKLTLEVRREMNYIGNYADILQKMTEEGIQAFDPALNLPVTMKTTYTFFLENLMSEMKPEITSEERQRLLMEQIRDANIKIPYEVMAERKLSGMFLTESPSKAAERILEEAGFGKRKRKRR